VIPMILHVRYPLNYFDENSHYGVARVTLEETGQRICFQAVFMFLPGDYIAIAKRFKPKFHGR